MEQISLKNNYLNLFLENLLKDSDLSLMKYLAPQISHSSQSLQIQNTPKTSQRTNYNSHFTRLYTDTKRTSSSQTSNQNATKIQTPLKDTLSRLNLQKRSKTLTFQSLQDNIAKCNKCPSCSNSSRTNINVVNRDVVCLVVTQDSSQPQVKEYIEKIMNSIFLSEKEKTYIMTNVQKCVSREENQETITNCFDYLLDEISLYKPRFIIIFSKILGEIFQQKGLTVKTKIFDVYKSIPIIFIEKNPLELKNDVEGKKVLWKKLQIIKKWLDDSRT